MRNVKSPIAQLQANNSVTVLSAISVRQLPERFLEGRSRLYGGQFQRRTTARHSRNQTHRTGGNRANGEPLFPPLAPVQLSSIQGPGALSGALAHAPDQARILARKPRFLVSVVQGRRIKLSSSLPHNSKEHDSYDD